MSTSFTPGPWQAKHDYTVEGATTIIANVDGESFADGTTTHTYDFICTCEDEYCERLPNAQANARLIIAAPELFALGQLALQHMQSSLALILESHCLLDGQLQPIRDTLEDDARDEVERLEADIASARAILTRAGGNQ